MSYKLSKSYYLVGLECPRYLWTIINNPEKIRKETLAEKFTFSEGIIVGEIAKQLFPKGINIPIDDYSENILKTKEFLVKKKPLFEAGFEFNNCYSRADILVPIGKKWDIIEVKSGTRVKDINFHDVSFQKYVYEGNGLKINKCFILHLNKEYIRKREIDIENLFVKEDITSEVNELIPAIEERAGKIFKIISAKNIPKAGILLEKLMKNGNHDCLTEDCLELEVNNIFCLYRGRKLACELYKDGIVTIENIPEECSLNTKQKIQRDCEIKDEPYVNKEKLIKFLSTLQCPVYYLDFETFSTAIPMFDGLKPYAQVPFQFSLHIVKNEETKPQHYEFLYDGHGDPRKEFLQELQKVLGDKGSIVVYYKSFEIGRLKELAEYFPEHKEWVDFVLKRIVDLHVPFREFSYYNSKQQGSASIKAVLPAITGKSYQEMVIREGRTASIEFLRVTYEECDEKEKQKVRRNLLKYCEMDTLAQVMIVEKLREIVR